MGDKWQQTTADSIRDGPQVLHLSATEAGDNREPGLPAALLIHFSLQYFTLPRSWRRIDQQTAGGGSREALPPTLTAPVQNQKQHFIDRPISFHPQTHFNNFKWMIVIINVKSLLQMCKERFYLMSTLGFMTIRTQRLTGNSVAQLKKVKIQNL